MGIFTRCRRIERLVQINRVRAIKDEAMLCTNEGRLKKLIMQMPDVEGYSWHRHAFHQSIEVRLQSGHDYYESGDQCLQSMVVILYLLWVDKTLGYV